MTSQEAANVAVLKFGAPSDIAQYVWVRSAMDRPSSIPLQHVDTTTAGELRVGWDETLRFAVYAWSPAGGG